MNRYALTHLDDNVLLRDLAVHVTRNCTATADLLAHLAEVDARKLYRPAAHPSMHSYCVHVLRLSEQAAFKRIRVARLGREFPAVFSAIAEGRVHLRGMALLAPHMNPETAADLLEAATHKTCEEIETLLARRFPKPDLPSRVEAMSPSVAAAIDPLSTWRVQSGAADQLSPGIVDASAPHPKVAPLASERFSVQFTMGKEAHDKLRYTQSLLAHQVPAGNLPELFERALDALIAKLEKSRFAQTDRPRAGRQRRSTNPRHIPAHVKRAVRERDGDRCTFVSETGARCPAVRFLEFDHIVEVARGGEATIEGIRLRCRAHNQYEAERTFGAGFMQLKRDEARRAAAERRTTVARSDSQSQPEPESQPQPEQSTPQQCNMK